MEIPEHRAWMYNRLFPNRSGYYENFLNGLDEFINFACQQASYVSDGVIRCPCTKCKNEKRFIPDEVKVHILRKGFKPRYYYWTSHGEVAPRIGHEFDSGTTYRRQNVDINIHGETSGSSTWDNEHVMRYQGMIYDAAGIPSSSQQGEINMEELPNMESARFYEMLNKAQEPLWDGCETHSVLSTAVRMMSLKSDTNMSQVNFDSMAQLMRETHPPGNKVPTDFYRAKKLVRGLGMTSQKIHCCINGCMLYWKDDIELRECKFCNEPRFEEQRGRNARSKEVARKKMHYLPIIPRLQHLYASEITARQMRWHNENIREEGVMCHPSDGEAWKHFNRTYPDFAYEPRNVRLGLCSDGFNPFNQSRTSYSYWPVIITPYNLPPELCMTSPFMFLNMIIPGPHNPKSKIDVFLQPLIDELQLLWNDGVLTYDVSLKQNFVMRASLMWTIGDFSAYGMLSGWSTAGKLACPICMDKSKAFTLKHGRKNSWFDSHRQFLDCDHAFRRNRNDFIGGKQERSAPPLRLNGDEILEQIIEFPKITATGGQIRFPGYGETHNWTKRSIFWDLPYWKDNLIRHNLDVMHIEKNVFDNVFNTVMDNKDKTKDNVKARLDQAEICRRPELQMVELANGNWFKPKAAFCLTLPQRIDICDWLLGLKMPDGYASNISRCVDKKLAKLAGLKSHDCHVLMQCLLPIAFSALPESILTPIVELSQFFRDLCSATIHIDHMINLEESIPIILCKLERIFPPAFFDSMEHLLVHLPYEAQVGGPVQYRWMYPFERFLNKIKKTVNNRFRVEGSICEAYLCQEIAYFSSHYFESHVQSSRTRVRRNDYGVSNDDRQPTLSVFNLPGRLAGRSKMRYLDDNEVRAAQLHVLLNCEEVKEYLGIYVNQFQMMYGEQSAEVIDRQIEADFPKWFCEYVCDTFDCDAQGHVDTRNDSMSLNPHLRYLAKGPLRKAYSWPVIFSNGYKFHTVDWGEGKRTYNSGVCVSGTGQGSACNDFYGILKEIIELEWPGEPLKKLILFNCDWYDPSTRGTKLHKKYGTVEVKKNRRYSKYDPFVLASTATQVYYCPYPGKATARADWLVVMKIKPRSIVQNKQVLEVAYQEDRSHLNEPIGEGPIAIILHESYSHGEEVPAEQQIELQEGEHVQEDNDEDDLVDEEEQFDDDEQLQDDDEF